MSGQWVEVLCALPQLEAVKASDLQHKHVLALLRQPNELRWKGLGNRYHDMIFSDMIAETLAALKSLTCIGGRIRQSISFAFLQRMPQPRILHVHMVVSANDAAFTSQYQTIAADHCAQLTSLALAAGSESACR